MREDLPAKADFVVYGDLDEESACRSFLGKTKQQAQELISQNFTRYQEDFMFMGPVAFCYYLEALAGYIMSDYDYEESQQYFEICKFRLSDLRAKQMQPCAARVADSLDWIAEQMQGQDPQAALAVRETRDMYRKLASGES